MAERNKKIKELINRNSEKQYALPVAEIGWCEGSICAKFQNAYYDQFSKYCKGKREKTKR